MSAITLSNSVQRSRLCVFRNEKSMVFVTASVVAAIFARIESNASVQLTPNVPVFWISEWDIIQTVGESSWDAVIHRLEFGFLSIPFKEWHGDRLLAMVREAFPTAALQNPHGTSPNEAKSTG